MLSVSAIIPTQRPLHFLERAIHSVLDQLRVPDELIVVDDSGENRLDQIREVARDCGAPNAVVLENTHLKGASGARNAGAEGASASLVAFLDDDDEWLPSYIAEALAVFEETSLDVMCTDLIYRYSDGTERLGKKAPDSLAPELFLSANPGLIGSNCIVDRSSYEAINGFDESLLTLEDMDFGLRLSLLGRVRYARLPKRLVRHYQHVGPRLCTPSSEPMRSGVRRFWSLHSHRMSEAHREEFCRSVRHLWKVDEEGNFV